jgi:hypothetical protein
MRELVSGLLANRRELFIAVLVEMGVQVGE